MPGTFLETEYSDIRSLIERYTEDVRLLNRYYDIPMSEPDFEEKRSFFESYREVLTELNFDSMSQSERIDYILLRKHLEYELRKLDEDRKREKENAEYLPFADVITELENQRRRLDPVCHSEVASKLNQIPRQLDDVKKRLSEAKGDLTPAEKCRIYDAAKMTDRLKGILDRYCNFYDSYDPVFTWWMSDPRAKSSKALDDYAKFLREDILGIKKDREDELPVIGVPIGRDALLIELEDAMIPYSPEELIRIGEDGIQWCERELIKASNEMGYGDSWKDALEHVKRDHLQPGEQPGLIRDLALEAIDYLEENDLVTIPPLAKKMWRMQMMSPERQKVTPFFTGGEVISISFPTNGMSHEQKMMSMRGNNVHFARATVHHELIPGHHLQGFMAARYKPYRRIFSTPFFSEGWCLYWEMLLWDMGFPKTPENKIGMLFWRMHRCARIVFSLKFHLGRMTADECIDMLVDRIGHEKANAAAEVRRSFEGSYPPLYQCAYMIGGIQIMALHDELVKTGKMSVREFHDSLLRENAIPIELIRAALTGQPLSRDFVAGWRFADRR